MKTHSKQLPPLPVKGGFTPLYALSGLVALLMAAASVAGLGFRALVYPAEELQRSFVPNDAVNLFIGLPILLGSMGLTWRGKLIGLLCWPGALFYVLYNYTAYVFAMPLNWAFPLYLVLVMLCLYTLIALIAGMDGTAIRQTLAGAVPEKFAGGVLAGFGLLFLLRAFGVMVYAITSGDLPTEAELAVNLSDILTAPASILGGILLWQCKELGYTAGLGLLFQGSMLFIALIAFFLLQPLLTETPFAWTDMFVILVMGSIYFVPFTLFARGVLKRSS
ncbi:MAG: hypothetical protein FJZ87_06000 [Chloroflexi bacterium]|nr:hypothetical protein [Chloroflexota bacterium]